MSRISIVLQQLKSRYIREQFNPSLLGLFCNESYIIRHKLSNVIRREAPELKGNLLDFGCGSKPYQSLFMNSTNYVGVDIEISGHNNDFKTADYFYDGQTLPFESEFFDSIIAFEVLEHVPNVNPILAELNRVLKPGGKILISTPFMYPEHEAPFDYFRFTVHGFQKLMENNWKILRNEKLNNSHDVMFLLALRNQISFLQTSNSYVLKFKRFFIISAFNLVWMFTRKWFRTNQIMYTNVFIKASKISTIEK